MPDPTVSPKTKNKVIKALEGLKNKNGSTMEEVEKRVKKQVTKAKLKRCFW